MKKHAVSEMPAVSSPEFIEVTQRLMRAVGGAVSAVLQIEKITGGQRNLGITGEVGELRACSKLGLLLVSAGGNKCFDAIRQINGRKLRVQIKTKAEQTKSQMLGKLHARGYDYAILVLLKKNYAIKELYELPRERVNRVIRSIKDKKRKSRRAPTVAEFKRAANTVGQTVIIDKQGGHERR